MKGPDSSVWYVVTWVSPGSSALLAGGQRWPAQGVNLRDQSSLGLPGDSGSTGVFMTLRAPPLSCFFKASPVAPMILLSQWKIFIIILFFCSSFC